MTKSVRCRFNNALKSATVILCVAVAVLVLISFDNRAFTLKRGRMQNETYVKLIDVGQGDSILLYSNGYTALIDTGPTENAHRLIMNINSLKIDTIDILILTHIHTDHTGGVTKIVDSLNVDNIILPELYTFSEGIKAVEYAINALSCEGKGIYSAREGMTFNLGDFEIQILGIYKDLYIENNRSLIIKAEAQGKSFLFMGDAETDTENKLLNDQKPINYDVLKVGHHGSITSTGEDFLRAVSPEIALISLGKNNDFGHPSSVVLKRLKGVGAKTYRTDKQGSITLKIKNGEIFVETEK